MSMRAVVPAAVPSERHSRAAASCSKVVKYSEPFQATKGAGFEPRVAFSSAPTGIVLATSPRVFHSVGTGGFSSERPVPGAVATK
jgi:hypothetical protein